MPTEIEEVLDKLEGLGLIGRWFCERCEDRVPYMRLEMSQAESRRKHNRARHPKRAPAQREG